MASAFELVQADVTDVLGELLTFVDFRTPEDLVRFATPELGTDPLVAVPWEFVGRNDLGLFLGLPRSSHTISLRGVTVVDTSSESSDDYRYFRFIDWSTMLADEGVVVTLRPAERISGGAGLPQA